MVNERERHRWGEDQQAVGRSRCKLCVRPHYAEIALWVRDIQQWRSYILEEWTTKDGDTELV